VNAPFVPVPHGWGAGAEGAVLVRRRSERGDMAASVSRGHDAAVRLGMVHALWTVEVLELPAPDGPLG